LPVKFVRRTLFGQKICKKSGFGRHYVISRGKVFHTTLDFFQVFVSSRIRFHLHRFYTKRHIGILYHPVRGVLRTKLFTKRRNRQIVFCFFRVDFDVRSSSTVQNLVRPSKNIKQKNKKKQQQTTQKKINGRGRVF